MMLGPAVNHDYSFIEKTNPRKRIGSPEDIAGLVIYLCSRAGAYTVGDTITCDGGSWQGEVQWEIQTVDGFGIISGGAPFDSNDYTEYGICLEPGCYQVVMLDAYGDGWNGNILDVNGQQFTNTSGFSSSEFLEGAEGSCSDFEGCTDPTAFNYNPNACYDDSSCVASVLGCTNPTATTANYYLVGDVPEVISIGKPRSQPVVGITTGSTTIIEFQQGTGSQFTVGDTVNLSVTDQSYYDDAVTSAIVTAVNETYEPNADSGYCRRITLSANTTAIATAYSSSNYAELRNVFKVAGIRGGGTNAVVKVQQVQVVGG